MVTVGVDGVGGGIELLGGLGRGAAFGQEHQNLLFGGGELIEGHWILIRATKPQLATAIAAAHSFLGDRHFMRHSVGQLMAPV